MMRLPIGLLFFFLVLCKPTFAQEVFRIPFQLHDNRIFVEVEIADKTFHFLIDTSGDNLIDTKRANELGLTLQNPSYHTKRSGEQVIFWQTYISEATIGELRIKSKPFQVAPLDEIKSKLRLPFLDGILGVNTLEHFIVTFDFKGKMMLVENGRALDEGVSFELYLGQVPMLTIPFQHSQIKVGIDTGDRWGMTFMSHFPETNLNGELSDEKLTEIDVFGEVFGKTFYLENVEILGATIPFIQSRILIDEAYIDNEDKLDARLGGSLLSQGILTIDYINKKLAFRTE